MLQAVNLGKGIAQARITECKGLAGQLYELYIFEDSKGAWAFEKVCYDAALSNSHWLVGDAGLRQLLYTIVSQQLYFKNCLI